MESPTLFRTFASVSTLGHRGLPVGLTRLLLLKDVESRLAAFARAEVLRPCSFAVRSIARQTLGWVSLVMVRPHVSIRRRWRAELLLTRARRISSWSHTGVPDETGGWRCIGAIERE